jgi:hypothetical protein
MCDREEMVEARSSEVLKRIYTIDLGGGVLPLDLTKDGSEP